MDHRGVVLKQLILILTSHLRRFKNGVVAPRDELRLLLANLLEKHLVNFLHLYVFRLQIFKLDFQLALLFD